MLLQYITTNIYDIYHNNHAIIMVFISVGTINISMIEMAKRFEVIRLVDLVWRPRGAFIMTHDTEKNTRMMANTGCFAIIKKYSHSKILFTLTFSRLKGIINEH